MLLNLCLYVLTCSTGANSTTVARKSGDRYFQFLYYCSGRESEITDCSINVIDNIELECPFPDTTSAVGVECETAALGNNLTADCNKVHNVVFLGEVMPLMACDLLTWLAGGAIGAILSAVILSLLFVIITVFLKRKTTHRKM